MSTQTAMHKVDPDMNAQTPPPLINDDFLEELEVLLEQPATPPDDKLDNVDGISDVEREDKECNGLENYDDEDNEDDEEGEEEDADDDYFSMSKTENLHKSTSSGSLNERLAQLSSPGASSFWSSPSSLSPSSMPNTPMERSPSFKNKEYDACNGNSNSANSSKLYKGSPLYKIKLKDQPKLSLMDTNSLMKDEDGTSSSDDDDEEDFRNVDEMDGPLSPNGSTEDIASFLLHRERSVSTASTKKPSEDKSFGLNSSNKTSPTTNDVALSGAKKKTDFASLSPEKYMDEDFNLPVDHDLQKQLERRATEIMESAHNNTKLENYNGIHQPITKPLLKWKFKDSYFLEHEISLWFITMGNLSIMTELENQNREIVYLQSFHEYEFNDISKLSSFCYFAMGFYHHCNSTFVLKKNIRSNNLKLLKHMSTKVLAAFKQHAILCRDEKKNLAEYAKLLKYSSTTLYFMIVVATEERKNNSKNKDLMEIIDKFNTEIDNLEIMEFLIQYIEDWRWSSRLSMNIRSVMLILSKLIVLQFGDNQMYDDVEKDICDSYKISSEIREPKEEVCINVKDSSCKSVAKAEQESEKQSIQVNRAELNLDQKQTHKSKTKEGIKSTLKATPTQFEAFRADITARYTFASMNHVLDYSFEDSASLTQYINIPRPKKNISSSICFPPSQQDIQLSGRSDTPYPSPSSSPVGSSAIIHRNDGSIKKANGKKSYQTNLNYPSIYPTPPTQDSLCPDLLNLPQSLPVNVSEAINIMENNVELSLNDHQLSTEKLLFMEKERNSSDPLQIHTMKNLKNFDSYQLSTPRNTKTMSRIDRVYEKTLPNFKSLIMVIMQLIELNLSNRTFGSCTNIAQKRGLLSKRATLSTGLNICHLLCKWFKLSHICKFEYFTSLLYDAKYIELSTQLMEVSFANDRFDSIFKKRTECSFWNECEELYDSGSFKNSEDVSQYYSDDGLMFDEEVPSKGLDEQVTDTNDDDDDEEDVDLIYLNSEYCAMSLLQQVLGSRTQRLKFLPLNIGLTFKTLYQIFNLDLYSPILKITKELTPFKSKKWKSEHMDLISGVYLYEKLNLVENWVTGKDTTAEINDSYSEEFAIRTLLQFYHFRRYKGMMDYFGYSEKNPNAFLSQKPSSKNIF